MNIKVSHAIHKKELLLQYQEQKQKERQLQETALQEAQRLALMLVEQFGIERVYLVGPLAYNKFTAGMKLELALEGIPTGTYASALGYLKQSSTFELDLIDLQQADTWTKLALKEKGKLLAKK
ncbi:DNA polymerase, beta domain protein region [Candidatus Vecturithrix granuli]|uniref:DNA polymerase, beta domain protein region n=1 Tax=Vecturithrix granuli TaxID=1499967 RepID=A0A0S6WA52_VECG1|nr:DNA polymerase, beta domain protein region [Candidatus Vecturithrix granuli]